MSSWIHGKARQRVVKCLMRNDLLCFMSTSCLAVMGYGQELVYSLSWWAGKIKIKRENNQVRNNYMLTFLHFMLNHQGGGKNYIT